MKRLIGTALSAVVVLSVLAMPASRSAAETTASGDVVRTWNGYALQAARKMTGNAVDARAARLYAMVDVAIFDAVNGLQPPAVQREAALVAPDPGASGDVRAAAAGAAHDILVALDAPRASVYDEQLKTDLDAVRSTGQAEHGREWGGRVAAAVLDARANDGSVGSNGGDDTQPGGNDVGVFRASWSGIQFQALEPFAVDDPSRYLGDGPPALTSPGYAEAFKEVKALGDASRTDPDAPRDRATFGFWALAGGTSQPPGAWLQVALTTSASRGLSLIDTARLLALQTMAMADTVAPTYKTKVDYHAWRPATAINEAGSDGNDETYPPPPGVVWKPAAGGIGSSPEHWSGHSSFSAAGASVLAGFYCTDEFPFTLVSDSTGASRTYSTFSAAADEAGKSRIFGGIHFEFSNQAGLAAGRGIASEVLGTALRPVNEHVTDDTCAA